MPSSTDRLASVFVSYRRETGFYLAKSIFDHLHAKGFDVFMDVHALGAGEFEEVTLAEIKRRDFFVLVLTKGSLTRMRNANDWLRKELSTALTARRTIIPVLDVNFQFDSEEVRSDLKAAPQELRAVENYNAVRMPPPEYFESGLARLIVFLEKGPAVTAPPLASHAGKIAEAGRALRGLELPSTEDVTLAERKSLSWRDLQQRLLGEADAPAATQRRTLRTPDQAEQTGLGPSAAPVLKDFGIVGLGLTWSVSPIADQYVLERDVDSSFGHPTVAYQGDRTFYFPETTATSTHYYRVRAMRRTGRPRHSAWSNVVAVRPRISHRPVRLGQPKLTETPMGMRWTSVPTADEYVLEKATDPAFTKATEVYRGSRTESPIFLMTFSLFGEPGTDDYYRVRARWTSSGVDGPWSEVVAVKKRAPSMPLPAPKLTAMLTSMLYWTEVPSADEYVLERDVDVGFQKPRIVYRGAQTLYVGDPEGRARKFHYRVKARGTKPLRDGAWSNTVVQ